MNRLLYRQNLGQYTVFVYSCISIQYNTIEPEDPLFKFAYSYFTNTNHVMTTLLFYKKMKFGNLSCQKIYYKQY